MLKRLLIAVLVVVCLAVVALFVIPAVLLPSLARDESPTPVVSSREAVAQPAPVQAAPRVEIPKAVEPPVPAPAPEPAAVAPATPAPVSTDVPLTAETLKNSTWERDKFRIQLLPDGNVIIGNGPRAKWVVEGNRVKLFSDGSDEVHYLDIKGSKLYWEGQEIGRGK